MIKEIIIILVVVLSLFFIYNMGYNEGFEGGVLNESKTYVEVKQEFVSELSNVYCEPVTVNFPTCPVLDCKTTIDSTKTLMSLDKAIYRYEDLVLNHKNLMSYIDNSEWTKCVETIEDSLEQSGIVLSYFSDYMVSNNFNQESDEMYVYNYLVDTFDEYEDVLHSIRSSCTANVNPVEDVDSEYIRYMSHYSFVNDVTELPDLELLEVR